MNILKKLWRFITGKEESLQEVLEKEEATFKQEMEELEISYYKAKRDTIKRYDEKLESLGCVFHVHCSKCDKELESSKNLLLHHAILRGKTIDIYVCPDCGNVEYIDTKYRPGFAIRYKKKEGDNFLSDETYRFLLKRQKYFEKHPDEVREYIDEHTTLYEKNPELLQMLIATLRGVVDNSVIDLDEVLRSYNTVKTASIDDGVAVVEPGVVNNLFSTTDKILTGLYQMKLYAKINDESNDAYVIVAVDLNARKVIALSAEKNNYTKNLCENDFFDISKSNPHGIKPFDLSQFKSDTHTDATHQAIKNVCEELHNNREMEETQLVLDSSFLDMKQYIEQFA